MAPKASAKRVAAPRKRDAEVIAAATKVFYERGYSAATVQDVADELGILKGSVYHYIKTKEDLLFRLLEEVHDDVAEILEQVAAEEGLDPLQRLGRYVAKQVEYNLENLARISVYYHDFDRLGDERRKQVLAWREAHNTFVVREIKEAQAAGLADSSLDPRLAANLVFGTIIWPYRWYRTGRWSRQVIADHCARYVLNGLSPVD